MCKWEDDVCNNRPELFSKYCLHHENVALKEKLVVAIEALESIKMKSLDDKTPDRYIKSLKDWRDKTCKASFEALKKIKGAR